MSDEDATPPHVVPRPKIIAALAILWLLGVALFPILGFRRYAEAGAVPAASIPLAVISALMAYGLWTARPWARILQMVLLVPMMCLMPFGFAAILLLGYVGRAETRRYFVPASGGASWGDAERWSRSEWPWVAGILVALVMGVGLLAALGPLFRVWG